jgi:putative addiction module component (TIGR02574 family)
LTPIIPSVTEGVIMANTAKQLSAEAYMLSPVERIELVDNILASLDKPDSEIDALWVKEAEDRLSAWRSGEIEAVDLDQVLAKYR